MSRVMCVCMQVSVFSPEAHFPSFHLYAGETCLVYRVCQDSERGEGKILFLHCNVCIEMEGE